MCHDTSAHMSKIKELDVFSVRDLRIRSGDLLRDAEEGRLAVITKHGRPAILALPFDHDPHARRGSGLRMVTELA